MASADDVAALRRATNETDNTGSPYTDDYLQNLIDSRGSVAAAAASLWREKAAGYADMVNVTESGSARSLGDLHTQALRMAAAWDAATATPTVPVRRSGTVRIERV